MTIIYQKAAAAYRNIGIDSRGAVHDQYDLVAMVYETLLECLTTARGAIEQRDILLKVKKLNHAMRLLQEGLVTNLDLRNGGELANNLYNLYNYCMLRITQANANNDVAALDEVAGLIRTLADGWKQMRTPNASAGTPSAGGGSDNEPPRAVRQMMGLYGGPTVSRGALAGA